ncbi:MAG: type II toxin-antitoxin system HicA family toxin [Oscillospiraceae bacterium]|nr:type II toxin-antitoxin system HicA family toxin [Oscillospiraceae bacterium]
MKYSELEKMLRRAGCTIHREGASHTLWYSPITNKTFPVGRHKNEDVKTGTLNSILRAAGLK